MTTCMAGWQSSGWVGSALSPCVNVATKSIHSPVIVTCNVVATLQKPGKYTYAHELKEACALVCRAEREMAAGPECEACVIDRSQKVSVFVKFPTNRFNFKGQRSSS